MAKTKVLLIDGNNYVHRGWHACPPMSNSDGFATNGIKGTLSIVMADLRHVKPDRMIVVFDKGGKPNWRALEYPEYKKSPARVKGKDDNKEVFTQFKPIRKLIKSMGIRVLGKSGVEADDLIGTLAVMFALQGCEVIIASKDKDFASLVNKRIKMLQATTRKILGVKEIEENFGVSPDQMVEFLTLVGDKVDNIPGVVKCGDKTAAKWLKEYGSIQGLMKNIDDITPVLKKNLKEARKNFKWTKRLVTIKTDIPHKVTLENCAFKTPDIARIKRLCAKYEMPQTFKEIKAVLKTLKVEEESKWQTN